MVQVSWTYNTAVMHMFFPNDIQPQDQIFKTCRADKREEEISEHKAWHKAEALLLRTIHHLIGASSKAAPYF
jgi:hypothetical protein